MVRPPSDFVQAKFDDTKEIVESILSDGVESVNTASLALGNSPNWEHITTFSDQDDTTAIQFSKSLSNTYGTIIVDLRVGDDSGASNDLTMELNGATTSYEYNTINAGSLTNVNGKSQLLLASMGPDQPAFGRLSILGNVETEPPTDIIPVNGPITSRDDNDSLLNGICDIDNELPVTQIDIDTVGAATATIEVCGSVE